MAHTRTLITAACLSNFGFLRAKKHAKKFKGFLQKNYFNGVIFF